MLLKLNETSTKWNVLRSSKLLRNIKRFETVYLAPDLTKEEREKGKVLRAELNRRRQNGEIVTIKRGQIVQTSFTV